MKFPDISADAYIALRSEMVETQLRKRGIASTCVLDAIRAVPRHEFVPEEFRSEAYADKPLPIGDGQTISQPYMVAAMTEALELCGSERVLEVGTGSGYQTAVLSLLCREVVSVEQHAPLAEAAQRRLAALGYANVRVYHGDGSAGFAEWSPYDCILVAAGAPRIPPLLADELQEQGRLVIPVGDQQNQRLLQVKKQAGEMITRVLLDCRFVPLRGSYGWNPGETAVN